MALMTTLHSVSTAEAIAQLLQGAVGVLPTDTVYGLVACASNQAAVARLYELKKRDHKPGTIVAANVDQLVALGIKKRYLNAVADMWPNPLSIVLPVGPELAYLDQEVGSLAVRIPKDETLQKVLAQTGPLVTSSANQPGAQTAATLAAAYDYFGDSIDFYVDGGDLSGKPASTVIRVVDDAIEVLRQGALELDENGYPQSV